MPAPRTAPLRRWMAFLIVGGGGLLLIAQAVRMNRPWAARHLLPDILLPSNWLLAIVQAERLCLVAIACALLWAARLIATGRGDKAWRGIVIGMAALLALPASEGALQLISGRYDRLWEPDDQPLRRADPWIGWTYQPSRNAADPEFAARPFYAIDSHGYRVAASGRQIDFNAPSILFVGESIMFGKGVNWRDTLAGRMEALSGIQSANLAVNAYSVGQAYLHLARELPKFRQPRLVVILFSPSLMIRDLDRNRPWIDSAGRWHPAAPAWALGHLGRALLPYHSPAAIAEAIASDRRLLRADVAMARARGARPLIVVPFYQPERPAERALRQRVLDGVSLPYLLIPLDPAWRLPRDSHPDRLGHAAMARALWAAAKPAS